MVAAPLLAGPAMADAIQSASRAGKLSWRAPSVAAQSAVLPADPSPRPAQRDTANRQDWQADDSAASRDQASAASSPTNDPNAGSTLHFRSPTAAKPTTQASASSAEPRQAGYAEAAPAGSPRDDQHTLKASRLDRAARPYSRSRARRENVQRLAEADPSPYSGGSGADPNSTAIRQVSGEKPVGPALVSEEQNAQPTVREQELIEQAGLQEGAAEQPNSPFDRETPQRGPDEFNPNDQLVQGGLLPNKCPTPRDLKPLDQISINIAAEPGPFPAECGLGDEQFVPRNFACTTYAWKATALCHKPLYFEDWDLERYGHTASPLLQPLISAAQFYLVLPILPYKMGLEPPGECIYALGYYRPGSCAPRIIPNVPISLRAGLLEAGVWVAGVALVP